MNTRHTLIAIGAAAALAAGGYAAYALLFPDHSCVDRLASCWVLIEYRDILITVDRECKRTRDRSRRHIEPMRHDLRSATVLFEDFPLLDSESVLLVYHYESEVRECDGVLYECVRPEYDVCLARLESLPGIFLHAWCE